MLLLISVRSSSVAAWLVAIEEGRRVGVDIGGNLREESAEGEKGELKE